MKTSLPFPGRNCTLSDLQSRQILLKRVTDQVPSGRFPSENATLAKRAVETGNSRLRRIKKYSMMRLLAPIMFTGLAALSVETQKYLCAPRAAACRIVLSVLKMFTSTMRIKV